MWWNSVTFSQTWATPFLLITSMHELLLRELHLLFKFRLFLNIVLTDLLQKFQPILLFKPSFFCRYWSIALAKYIKLSDLYHVEAQNYFPEKSSLSLNKYLMKRKIFFVFSQSWDKGKNSESPWGIKPQAFRFHSPMLYQWARETLRWARSTMKFIWHVSCILLGSALLIASCLLME